jgi:hypothetical protein
LFLFVPYNDNYIKYTVNVKENKTISTEKKLYWWYDGFMRESTWNKPIPYDSLRFFNICRDNIFNNGEINSYNCERKN